MHKRRFLKIFWSVFILLTLSGVLLSFFFSNLDFSLNWHTANRSSAKMAPLPSECKEAIVQVYAARAFNWRGLFAVHTWIAAKEKNANSYTVYQVVDWLRFLGLPSLSVKKDIPDRIWFGQKPLILSDIRGVVAENIIHQLPQVVSNYPWKNHYVIWPGPNSNTFIAYIARKIPQLHSAMMPIAIGKDYLGAWKFYDVAPSNTGYQVSLYGVLGILLAKEEGLEINVCGVVFGFNFKKHALLFPGIGYISY